MKKIGIIGAGYTGLSAAYRLSKAGFDVTLLEKGQYPGGLAGGFKMEGNNLEIAYHHIFKTDKDIINLAKEIGADTNLKWHNSSVALYYNGKLYPFMSALDLLRFSPLSFFNRIRAGLVVLYLQKLNRYKRFIKIPAYNWMLKNAGKSVTKVIWEPLLKGKFDQFYNKVSMAWLWARIHIRANSREMRYVCANSASAPQSAATARFFAGPGRRTCPVPHQIPSAPTIAAPMAAAQWLYESRFDHCAQAPDPHAKTPDFAYPAWLAETAQ